jgi:hypothetical protein
VAKDLSSLSLGAALGISAAAGLWIFSLVAGTRAEREAERRWGTQSSSASSPSSPALSPSSSPQEPAPPPEPQS